ncbi:TolC family protein [Pseudomonas sp. BN515]|uniref:TolC family protein n=1 Tax=Pseudomonas sp. BN515 TaxID=2567892 RepID=UPI002455A1F0|nr:TolC family protein [Pseudomonas sp. BN515]MDH4873975.1 TolC family protein [Pseudomonas sp. BN515]
MPSNLAKTTAIGLMLYQLAGCTVGPDYHTPASNLSVPLAGGAKPELPMRAPAPPLEQWWKGFADPVLDGIVQRALDQNLDMAIALARVEQARAAANLAGAARLPEGSLDGRYLHQRQSLKSPEGQLASSSPGFDRNQDILSLGVGASWEADLAGGLKRSDEAALAELQAAEASRAGVRVSIAAEAADAYFRIRGAQRRIQVAQEQIQTQQDLLALVQDRFNGGVATQRELAQAKALLLQARTVPPPLRTELAVQLNRLDVLLGVQPGTYAKVLLEHPQDYQVPGVTADLSPASLLRRRPDVIAAERRLAASTARIGVAVAEYYPHVTLGGILGSQSLHGGLFSSDAFQPQAFIGLHWRLFDFGRVDAEVAQARGSEAQALAEYRQTMLRAAEDVENAITTQVHLSVQRQELDAEIEAHHVAREAARQAYEGGAVSLREVLDEDQQLLAARDLQAQLAANDARAAVATFRALGGGW